MERLNEFLGKAVPKHLSPPTRSLHPYQERQSTTHTVPIESATYRRTTEQISQPPSSHQDTTYPSGNVGHSRPNNQPTHNSNHMHNQRRSYGQGASDGHTLNQQDYTFPYNEQSEPNYRQSKLPERRSTGILPIHKSQLPARVNHQGTFARQERHLHHADSTNYAALPNADVLENDDFEDDDFHMGYGDWEEVQNQILVYRRSDVETQPAARHTATLHETTTAYMEPTILPQGRPTRNLHEIHNDARHNQRSATSSVSQPRPNQHYQRQTHTQFSASPASSNPSQSIPPRPGHPGPQQPSHPAQELGPPPPQRMTQPLDPRNVPGLGRPREYTSPLLRARNQVQDPPPPSKLQPEQREPQTVRPVPQPQSMQAPPLATGVNKTVCTICHGAGYLRVNVPFGHPSFGKPLACACKEAERKEKRRQQLRTMSNLDAFRQQTFSSFNIRIPGVKDAYDAAKEFAEDPDGWLILVGPNGCGKTHLAAAIANQTLDRGAVVLFEAVPDLLDHLRAAFAPTSAEIYDQLFSKMREAELLILDDFGAQQSSPWANEKLFQLLNYRYNLGLPTVITANPKGMQGIDERIKSRLSDIALVTTINMDRTRDQRPYNPRHHT
jgi:DNA replication protein DnaC